MKIADISEILVVMKLHSERLKIHVDDANKMIEYLDKNAIEIEKFLDKELAEKEAKLAKEREEEERNKLPKIAGLTKPEHIELWVEGKPIPRKFI